MTCHSPLLEPRQPAETSETSDLESECYMEDAQGYHGSGPGDDSR